MKPKNSNKQFAGVRSIICFALIILMLMLFGDTARAQFVRFRADNGQGVIIYYQGIDSVDARGVAHPGKYVMVVSPISSYNPDYPENIGVGAYNYNFDGIGSDGTITPLIIPRYVTNPNDRNTYEVIEINDHAFHGCRNINGGLSIPNSVIRIRDDAFFDCYNIVGPLTFPTDLLSIGEGAFEHCAFTGPLNIPTSVRDSIGDYAFRWCQGFTGDLTIPNSMTKIGNGVFEHCSGLKGTLSIPSTITSIGDSTFCECTGLSGQLTIPCQVNSIGQYAFYHCCSFTGIDILPFIEDGSINTPPNAQSGVDKISSHAFALCTGLTGELRLYKNVLSIENSAFYGCGRLTSLLLPDGLLSIGDESFCSCSELRRLTIPSSVNTIGEGAFRDCSMLGNGDIPVTIPANVKSLGSNAFHNDSRCIIIIPDDCTNTTIGERAFGNTKGVWFTSTKPSNFSFHGPLGDTTYYIPEDDTSDDSQGEGSIKYGYQTLITGEGPKFRYYHLGLTTVSRTLAQITSAKYGSETAGVSTLYVNFPALVPKGLVAYRGKSVSSDLVGIESLNYEEGLSSIGNPSISNNVTNKIIPTKCAVVLLGDVVTNDTVFEANNMSDGRSISAEPTESDGNPADKGILSGSLTRIDKSNVETEGSIVFTLGALNTSEGNGTGPVGFYPYTGSQLSAHKAYLLKTTAMQSKGGVYILSIGDDNDMPTGISETRKEYGTFDDVPYYNLEGMKVNKPIKGGIYIHKGKKVVII